MNRTGIALIIVLAVVVVLLLATVGWLRAAGAAQSSAIVLDADTRLGDLLASGERLGLHYLRAHAGTLVAPPEGGGWTLVRDAVGTGQGAATITVTVYDGWSGIPAVMATPRGALRRDLPDGLAAADSPDPGPLRVEMITQPTDYLERFELPAGMRRFPDPQAAPVGSVSTWSAPGPGGGVPAIPGADQLPGIVDGTCLALVLSPHSDGRINLNTAPLTLVQRVYRLHGLTMPEELRAARRHQIRSTAPPPLAGSAALPQLVDASLVWNCLITAGWNGQERSWWVVFAGEGRNLHVIQRHADDS